jgi:hypothetical protein
VEHARPDEHSGQNLPRQSRLTNTLKYLSQNLGDAEYDQHRQRNASGFRHFG